MPQCGKILDMSAYPSLPYNSAMDRTELHPLLVLHCPPGHEVDPRALKALQQFIGDEFDASVLLNPFHSERHQPPRILVNWRMTQEFVLTELGPFLETVFFNFDWLDEAL